MGQITKDSDTTYHTYIKKSSSVRPAVQSDTSTGITIQNSYPKGDRYTDPDGKAFGYAVFWTRVINDTDSPLELTINFPADSFAILAQHVSLKIFPPPDKMAIDRELLYNYGATGLNSFSDTGLNKPTMLRRTIDAKEEYLFYIGILFLGGGKGGAIRTGLVLKDENLFYRISIAGQFDSALIPCGKIVFKK